MNFLIAELSRAFEPLDSMPLEVAAIRLVAALVLGGIIGWDREVNARAAGLRTHMLISLAAATFAIVAMELTSFESAPGVHLQTDPLRLIEAVTAGVAFLAAGSIITSGGRITGLTTGAGMWMAGAIGLACGTGRLPLAVMATVMAVVVLWLLGRVSRALGAEAPPGD